MSADTAGREELIKRVIEAFEIPREVFERIMADPYIEEQRRAFIQMHWVEAAGKANEHCETCEGWTDGGVLYGKCDQLNYLAVRRDRHCSEYRLKQKEINPTK